MHCYSASNKLGGASIWSVSDCLRRIDLGAGPKVKMKHILSPGFSKSGTTFLFGLLHQCPHLVGSNDGKELNAFLHGAPRDYDAQFSIKPEQHVATIEFSPIYLSVWTRQWRRNILCRIQQHLPDAVLVVALRAPIARAVSHYWHLVQSFGRFGAGRFDESQREVDRIYAHIFETSLSADIPVGCDIAEALQDVHDIFGRNRVVHFFLETDGRDVAAFWERLCGLLDLSLPLPCVEAGGMINQKLPLPKVFFADSRNREIVVDGTTFILPENSVYIAAEGRHELLLDVDPLIGRAWEAASTMWTASLDSSLLNNLHDRYFSGMALRLSRLLSETADAKRAPDYENLVPGKMSVARANYDQKFLLNKAMELGFSAR